MKSLPKPRPAILVIGNILLTGLLWIILRFLSLPEINCVQPLAQSLLYALGIILVLNLPAVAIFSKFRDKRSGFTIAFLFILAVVTWWLGSYPYSPILGFVNGQNSVLSGFRVTRQGRAVVTISSGDMLSLARGSYTSIEALVTPENASCMWQSINGAALDGSDTCDLIYSPPKGTDYDILKVLVTPACHLSKTTGQIKISILP